MNKLVSFKLILYILLATFAFYINYYYANKGLYPIDTFTFFDARKDVKKVEIIEKTAKKLLLSNIRYLQDLYL